MGGRGSSSGESVSGKKYGSEYKSLLTYGNIKFVVHKDGNPTSPMETMTNNRVYVTLDRDGDPKYISYYDKNNKRRKQIDLTVPHRGVIPHTHHGYFHKENDTAKGFTNLTAKEQQMVYIVEKVWKEKKNVLWERWKARNKNELE